MLPLLAFQPDHPQALTGLTQPQVGGVEVQCVVLVIARHKQHRHRPAGMLRQGREALQAPIGLGHAAAVLACLVGANVAGEHQQVGVGGGLDAQIGVGFKVQIAQQLNLHAGLC